MNEIIIANKTEDECLLYFNLDVNCPLLEGHFPSNPIFPAIGLIEIIVKSINEIFYLDSLIKIKSLKKVKFMDTILPNERVEILIKMKEANSFSCQVKKNSQVAAVLSTIVVIEI